MDDLSIALCAKADRSVEKLRALSAVNGICLVTSDMVNEISSLLEALARLMEHQNSKEAA